MVSAIITSRFHELHILFSLGRGNNRNLLELFWQTAGPSCNYAPCEQYCQGWFHWVFIYIKQAGAWWTTGEACSRVWLSCSYDVFLTSKQKLDLLRLTHSSLEFSFFLLPTDLTCFSQLSSSYLSCVSGAYFQGLGSREGEDIFSLGEFRHSLKIHCLFNRFFFSFITDERLESWVLRLHAPVSFTVILLRLQCMHQVCASLGIRASHTTPNNLAVHFGHVFNFFQLQSSHWIFNKHCRSESILSF